MKSVLKLLAILFLVPAVSCEADWVVYPDQFVVEGTIESGGNPVVILTKTISPSEEDLDVMEEYMKLLSLDPVISVSDGNDTVLLDDMTFEGVFPAYTTSRMVGEPGKTYTLDIRCNGQHLTAVTSIPAPRDIDSLMVYKAGSSSGRYGITAGFSDDRSIHSFYQFFVMNGTAGDARFYPAGSGMIDNWNLNTYCTTADTAGLWHKVYQNIHKELLSDNDSEHREPSVMFEAGDEVTVKLATLDSVSSEIWRGLDRGTKTDIGFVAIIENLKSNVNGGMGFWCGLGVSTASVTVGR